ncbi:hypothetical protein HER32_00310 [Hymenobacter sp. BT18]|uniref:hypothetical protein n=1 Tax=Hymenobacter sp. BT18 TaxID=2835648 RepID=UPI00143EBFDF|nr:hypothetical protein [Hymenobacter sp. BT18]QIX59653.1 hypothetical protein HER32_00310 [Hymenobacter sp. BT18]
MAGEIEVINRIKRKNNPDRPVVDAENVAGGPRRYETYALMVADLAPGSEYLLPGVQAYVWNDADLSKQGAYRVKFDLTLEKEPDGEGMAAGTVVDYWRGDKSWQPLNKAAVGLALVPNVDATNPANIVQTATYRMVTDAEKAAWNAKQAALGYTAENVANKGQAGGYVPLNGTTKIDSVYLPSYVDDVVESATVGALPAVGEAGKIYVVTATNEQYRWSGSTYIKLVASPGSTDDVPEGATNKYFTDARVLVTTLVGYAIAGVAGLLSAGDSLLVALGKLEKQIAGKADTNHTHATATGAAPGFMSAAHYTKLENLTTVGGGELPYNPATAYAYPTQVTYDTPAGYDGGARTFRSKNTGAAATQPAPLNATNVVNAAWEEVSKALVGTLYVVTGTNTNGSMTQKAVTDALNLKADKGAVPSGAGMPLKFDKTYIYGVFAAPTAITVDMAGAVIGATVNFTYTADSNAVVLPTVNTVGAAIQVKKLQGGFKNGATHECYMRYVGGNVFHFTIAIPTA